MAARRGAARPDALVLERCSDEPVRERPGEIPVTGGLGLLQKELQNLLELVDL